MLKICSVTPRQPARPRSCSPRPTSPPLTTCAEQTHTLQDSTCDARFRNGPDRAYTGLSRRKWCASFRFSLTLTAWLDSCLFPRVFPRVTSGYGALAATRHRRLTTSYGPSKGLLAPVHRDGGRAVPTSFITFATSARRDAARRSRRGARLDRNRVRVQAQVEQRTHGARIGDGPARELSRVRSTPRSAP
jgi:hypothetical protein